VNRTGGSDRFQPFGAIVVLCKLLIINGLLILLEFSDFFVPRLYFRGSF
jgi:hypothetical protein